MSTFETRDVRGASQPEDFLQEDLNYILQHCKDLFHELKGRQIFISGGTGFLGFWLVNSFCYANRILRLGAKAAILTRNPDGFEKKWPYLARDPGVCLVQGDIRDFPFPEGEYQFGIHAAAPVVYMATNASSSLDVFSTIVDGTTRYLDFAVASKMQKLLFVSSGAVYGRQPPELARIPENYSGAPDPSLPDSAYGEGKRAAEQLCVLYQQQHGIETKIARCFTFVGPELPLNGRFAIGNFILNSLRNENLLIKGDGTAVRTYLYAADLAVWLWTILVRGTSGRPYNVGSEHPYSILEIAKAVLRYTSAVGQIRVENSVVAGASRQRYVPNIDRCKVELGVKERYSLEQAITRTFHYVGMQKTCQNVVKFEDGN